jgi:hypothetical protein
MACHGVISAGFGRNRFCIKLEITPPSISNHSRYGTGIAARGMSVWLLDYLSPEQLL